MALCDEALKTLELKSHTIGDIPRKREDNSKREDRPDSTPCEITPHYTPNNKPKRLPEVEITVKSGNWRLPPRSRPPPPRANDEEAAPEDATAAFNIS